MGGDWLFADEAVGGVSRLRASLERHGYSRHRHDNYTIALTERGVQEFDYRGGVHRSLPGQVVVLHPDELHDGRPGTGDGFVYRTRYVDPARVFETVRAAGGPALTLPFVATPVLDDPALARILSDSFDAPLEPLGADELVHEVSLSLLRLATGACLQRKQGALSDAALSRAREFLDANCLRVVSSTELERVCGHTRFAISAAFRQRFGTSPHRYLLMRRLEVVRSQLPTASSIAALACDAAFADQAHMTRMFRQAFGMTPGAYAGLRCAGRRRAG